MANRLYHDKYWKSTIEDYWCCSCFLSSLFRWNAMMLSFCKRRKMYSFLFQEEEKKTDGVRLSLLWRNSCQEETKTYSFAEKEGKRRRMIFLFSFLFPERRRKGMLRRFWMGRKRKMGKRKREQAPSLVQAFDTLSAAACDEEVVLIVRTVVDIVSEKHLISFFHDDGKSIINQKSTFLYPRFPRSSSLLIFS